MANYKVGDIVHVYQADNQIGMPGQILRIHITGNAVLHEQVYIVELNNGQHKWCYKKDLQPPKPVDSTKPMFAIGDTVYIFMPNHRGQTTPGQVIAVLTDLPGYTKFPQYVIEVVNSPLDNLLEIRDCYNMFAQSVNNMEDE